MEKSSVPKKCRLKQSAFPSTELARFRQTDNTVQHKKGCRLSYTTGRKANMIRLRNLKMC